MNNIADALRQTLISPNVSDSNLEPANIVDVVDKLALNIREGFESLGLNGASTGMGAIESHAKAILDGSQMIAGAINNLASAIENLGKGKE